MNPYKMIRGIITIALAMLFGCSVQDEGIEISEDSNWVLTSELGRLTLINHVPDGQYFVTRTYDCGQKDTLLIALVKNGRREGKWIYYEEPIMSPCSNDKELLEIDIYDRGDLIRCEYHTGSGVVYSTYQASQKQHNGDQVLIDYVYANGTRVLDSILDHGHMIRKQFDKQGDLQTYTTIIKDTFLVTAYYPSGTVSDRYRLVSLQTDTGVEEVFDGLSMSWDEEGSLIDETYYHLGEAMPKN